jgi:predicted nucleotidyltransferase
MVDAIENQNTAMIRHVGRIACSFPSANRIYLFGSRAKGTAVEISDFDIAVDWLLTGSDSWGAFAERIREGSPVLNQIDLVRLDQCGDELISQVFSTGKVIYEKT